MAHEEFFDEAFTARFRIERALGTGGAGQVFKAIQLDLERAVAIKLINPRLVLDKEALERFVQEGQIASRLQHQNIVQVIEVGSCRQRPYIVYELVEGRDLADLVQRVGTVPVEQAMGLMEGIAEGLAVAHKQGVIHRDLKAENILLDTEGKVKIADFGIAKWSASRIKTETGVVLGTPSYMSPEQVRGEPVTTRSDVYSLGIIFYEILSGKLPFWGKTPMETALKQLHNEAPPLELPAAGDLGRRLDRLIRERMLCKDAADRLADADEFLARLRAVRAKSQDPAADAAESVPTRAMSASGSRGRAAHATRRGDAATRTGDPALRTTGEGGLRAAGVDTLAQSKAGTVALEMSAVARSERRRQSVVKLFTRERMVVVSLGALFLTFVAVVAWMFHNASDEAGAALPPGQTWDVRDLKESTSMSGATLSWHSTVPYPTELVYRRREDGEVQVARGADEGPTTEHLVTLEELGMATVYVYQLRFPDRSMSLQRQFTTKGFKLLKKEARWVEPGLVAVEVATVNPYQVRLLMSSGEKSVAEQVTPDLVKAHVFSVRAPEYHRPLTYSLLFYANVGDAEPGRVYPQEALPSYTGLVESNAQAVGAAVRGLHLAEVIDKLSRVDPAVGLGGEGLRELGARVQREVPPILAGFRPYAAFFFTDRKMSLGERHDLYLALQEVVMLRHYLALGGLRIDLDVEPLLVGDYALGAASQLAGTPEQRPVTFVSRWQRHEGLSFGAAGPLARVPEKVPLERVAQIERAELFVQTKGFTERMVLRVRLNDLAYLFRGGVGQGALYQALDPRVLVEGENGLTFDLILPTGQELPAGAFAVERAVLRLNRLKKDE